MEEKNKYYTPTIEEFHVGFEYEYRNHFGKNAFKWTKEIFTNQINKDLLKTDIRVKYLDSEDFQELNVSLVGRTSSKYVQEHFTLPGKSVRGENIDLLYNYVSKWMLIYTPSGNYFAGYVKNKSELKRILKQIGYVENN